MVRMYLLEHMTRQVRRHVTTIQPFSRARAFSGVGTIDQPFVCTTE
jgi:hypothetical protein